MPGIKTNESFDELAETLENADGVEVVGHVDIANKSVQDVLVVKGSITEVVDMNDAQSDETPQGEHDQEMLDEVKSTASQITQKATDFQEQLQDQAQNLKQEVSEHADEAKQAVQSAATMVQDKAAKLKEAGDVAITDAKSKAEELMQASKDKMQDIEQDIEDAADELKERAADEALFVKDKAHAIKQKAQEIVDEATNVAQNAIDDIKDKFEHLKADAQDKAESLKSDAQDKGVQLKDKAEQLTEDIKAKTEEATQIVKDKVDAVVENVDRIQAHHDSRPQVGFLTKIGAYFDGMTSGRQQGFASVDLNSKDFDEDAFRSQAATIGSQLFGGKLAKAQSLVGKFTPSASADSISKAVFDKIAYWANDWAKKDLQKDSRLGKLNELTDAERDEFARDVANQNRALALMGGLSGLFGVKGVIADTAWLLMVSLKSVYQLAIIYDKPLMGADGIKLAYGVLSGANLSKLQEKQVILTALALGNTFFVNAQDPDLKKQLERADSKFRIDNAFAKQLDDLSHFVDIEKLNFGWFKRVLSVASVGTSVYYNRELIEEVLGTAMATFRPERPQLLTQSNQSSLEAKRENDDLD